GPVDLVQADDRGEPRLERLREHEAGLGQRPLGGVDQEEHAVDHRQGALDLAAEVRVPGRVHDVDAHALPGDGRVLGQDGDAALALEREGVHHPVGDLLVGAEDARLAQHGVDQGRLPVVDVRDDGDVAHVGEQGGNAWWTCDGSVLGPFGMQMMKDYSAIARAGIEDDGVRAATPALRLADMDRDGIHASVIYGPNLFGLPIADPELHAAVLAGYNDWASEFNRHDPGRLSVLPVLPAHDPAGAIAELGRVARAGHRGVIISPFEFRCSDREWEPFWDAAEETGLPVSFHIGRGTSQVRVAPR